MGYLFLFLQQSPIDSDEAVLCLKLLRLFKASEDGRQRIRIARDIYKFGVKAQFVSAQCRRMLRENIRSLQRATGKWRRIKCDETKRVNGFDELEEEIGEWLLRYHWREFQKYINALCISEQQ